MSDQPPPVPPSSADSPPRLPGKGGPIVLLVLSALTLLAFGRPFAFWQRSGDYNKLIFDIFGCMAIGGAVYAVIFLIRRTRSLLKLPVIYRAVAFAASSILIASVVLSFVRPQLPFGQPTDPPIGAGGHIVGRSVPRQWVVNGRACQMKSVYWTVVGDGLQFWIECPCIPEMPLDTMTQQQALQVALPLMAYAYETGLYDDCQGFTVGGHKVTTHIGVALFNQKDGKMRVNNVVLSVDEIKQHLQTAESDRP